MNQKTINPPKFIQTIQSFKSLPGNDQMLFIKTILTPARKKKIFFSSLENIRLGIKKALPKKADREVLFKDAMNYVKRRKQTKSSN